MSLTSCLEDPRSAVSVFLRREFPQTRGILADWRSQLTDVQTIRPDGPVPWSIIGMAIDYRIRYYFTGMASLSTVAEIAARSHSDRETLHLRLDRVDPFFERLDADAASMKPAGRLLTSAKESLLNRYCVILAYLEVERRSGRYPENALVPPPEEWIAAWDDDPTPLLALAPPDWIADLGHLSRAFFDRCFGLLHEPAVLNPRFDGSGDVGGADADLIADGCLVDIKTTVDPRPQTKTLYQLLGYVLLDYSNRYNIREVAIYFARQQTLLRWPLDTLLPGLAGSGRTSLADLRTRFRETITSDART